MIYSNTDFSVVYIDPSIAIPGDGGTPATALADLPSASNLGNNTCYLIRRTDSNHFCALPAGTNNSIENILFMGMPLASDKMFLFIPEEAKTAWAGDTESYARISASTSSASLNLPGMRSLLLHRISFSRSCTSASQYLIKSDYTGEFKSTVSVEHCRFGADSYDENNPSLYTGTALNRYLYFGLLRCLSVRDTDMIYSQHYADSNNFGHGISCSYPELLIMEDIRLSLIASSVSRSSLYAFSLCNSTSYTGLEANISGVDVQYLANGNTAKYFGGAFNLCKYLSARIYDITGESVIPEGISAPSDTLHPVSSLINTEYLHDFTFRDFNLSLPHFWKTACNLINISGYMISSSPGIERNVSDIQITFGNDENTAVGSCYSYTDARNDSNYLLFITLIASNDGFNGYPKVCKVENVEINSPRSKAFGGRYCRVSNSSFAGYVNLQYSVADIEELSTWFPGYPLYINASSVRIGKLDINKENPVYPYSDDPAIERYKNTGTCIVEESNVIAEPISLTNESTLQQNCITCFNEAEQGHFTLRTRNIAADTWNVHRTGGAAACLKLWNPSWNNTSCAVLGGKPFMGRLINAPLPGRYLLKIHIAYKGYPNDNELNRRLFFTATVNEKGSPRTLSSSTDGRWLPDPDSVWENDSSLTQKVLEIPLDVESPGMVDVRLFFAWYSPNAFVYVDPAFTLNLQE